MKKLLFILTLLTTTSYAQSPPPCFPVAMTSSIAVGAFPYSITSADFNTDGNVDLAIAHGNSGYISILLGSGSGVFAAAVNYSVAIGPVKLISIISGDFNADGKIDLAVADSTSDIISILLGSNTGTFAAAINHTLTLGSGPSCLTTADFNSDGKMDLAVVNSASATTSVLLGSGTGTFVSTADYAVGSYPRSLISADFNADGKMDLAVANDNSNNISILLGTPSGTFVAAVNYVVGSFPRSITSADFNADGKMDLAVANYGSNHVSVLLGGGTGTFVAAVNYTVGSNPYAMTSADFNGDGKIDLVAANHISNNISILLGSSSGTFAAAVNYATGSDPISLTSADFNSDGKKDLAVTDLSPNHASVLLNGLPTVTVNSGSVCSGKTFTIMASGASTYTWSSGALAASIAVNPVSTTTYSVFGTSSMGCNAAIKISTVSVNASPIINTTSSSSSLCAFTNATLTASGAVTYTWSTGSNSVTAIVTPSISSSYTVIGTNVSGCTNSSIISLLVVNSTNITGSVTTGASVPVAGYVTLYRYEPMFTKFDSVSTINISGTGAYTFTNAINSNTYIIRATPITNTLLVTYGNSSISWQTATQLIHGCANTSTININVISLAPITPGLGSLSGTIEKGPGYGLRTSGLKPLSTPIRGISVKGGKNPGGNIVAQTTTDANGTYTLSGLPTSGDNYFILVDIPGLDTNNTYHKILTLSNTSFDNLNFIVDSAKINPVNNVGINELILTENNISVFPNPTTSDLSINFSLIKTSSVKIELFDLLGKQLKTLVDSKMIVANNYNSTSTITDLDAGIYLVKIAINNKEQTVKICLQK